MNFKDKIKIAMQLSQSFEGTVPFANITGNFDGMWLSCGSLGKTFQNGEQQGLVKSFIDRHGANALRQLMPTKGREYIRLCRMSPAQAKEGIIAWSKNRTSANVKQPHKNELEAFWTSPGMVRIQVEHAMGKEGRKTKKAVENWGGKNNLHEFCFFFDIMTMQGSMKGVNRASVDEFIEKKGGLRKAGKAIADACENAGQEKSNFRDARRNGRLWRTLFESANRNTKKLFILGFLRSKKARARFVFTAMNRRGTFGLGEGFVNQSRHDLSDEMGMKGVAEALPGIDRLAAEGTETPAGKTAKKPKPENVFRVRVAELNFRSSPKLVPSNRIGRLHQGQIVIKIKETGIKKWWKVSADMDGETRVGFVSSRFLKPTVKEDATDIPATAGAITAVHMNPTTSKITRSRDGGRAHKLNENNQPARDGTAAEEKIKDINKIIDYLAVQNVQHRRYQPKPNGTTYCNIYAYDYCCLAGVYLPRIWWKSGSIEKLAQGIGVPVKFEKTVTELRANDLHDWFKEFGQRFGWRRAANMNALQEAANRGAVGIIVAQRTNRDRPGHIVAVAPETNNKKAKRENGKVKVPLQSQAGTTNFKRNARDTWWLKPKFRDFGIWIHA